MNSSLPTIGFKSVRSLARRLGLSVSELESIVQDSETHYRPFDKEKRDGTKRHIDNPIDPLKSVQRQIYTHILAPLPQSSLAFGGVKGRSCVDGASQHVRKPYVVCLDIRHFFPSVSHHHVYGLFVAYGCSPDVASVLTRLTTRCGYLPQGSPASTAIANLLLVSFDQGLGEFASSRSVTVSRVIDDITISGDAPAVHEVLGFAIRSLHRLGLPVHRGVEKLRIQVGRTPQLVNGYCVNSRVSVPRTYRRKVRDKIRAAKRFGISKSGHRSLIGKVNHIRAIHTHEATLLHEQLKEVVLR